MFCSGAFCMTSDLENSDSKFNLARKIKGLSDSSFLDFQNWPTPDEGSFPDNDRSLYFKRKTAVQLYLSGCPASELKEKSGFARSHIYRMVTERCLKLHPDGLIYGWRGLVPNLRLNPYTRKNLIKIDAFGNGAAGAMQTVLDINPDIRTSFEKRILGYTSPNKLGETKRSSQEHLKWFLNKLRGRGYEIRNEWPFNTENFGYVTVCNYIKEVLDSNPKKAARILGGLNSERKLLSGDGVDRPVYKIYQRVEMDAHHTDTSVCIMMPTVSGDYVPKIIHRIWVIVILDVFSRAVLGYYMSMGKEVSKDDVLRTIKSALSKWSRKNLSFCKEDEAYEDGGGLPSGIRE